MFVAVAGATAILAVAAASGPLFLGSLRTATLHERAAQVCPQASQPGIANPTSTPQSGADVRHADTRVRDATRRAGLPAPYLVAHASAAIPPTGGAGMDEVELLSRPGAVEHVHVLRSAGGSGLWLPESLARGAGLRPGRSITLGTGPRQLTARIAGTYRDLPGTQLVAGVNLPRYWCTWQPLIVPTPERSPPPLVLTDLPTVLAAGQSINAHWYVPIDVDQLSTPDAADVVRRASGVYGKATAGQLPLYVGSTTLSAEVGDADRTLTGLRGPLLAVSAAGVFAGVLLLAGAGGFWTIRRSAELRLLASRGTPPVAIAAKAALEMLAAVVVGGLVGWSGAIALVRAFGPSTLLDPGSSMSAGLTVAVAAAAGLLVASCVGGAAVRDRSGRRLSVAALVPLELAALAAAVVSERLIDSQGGASVGKHNVVAVNSLMLVSPLLDLAVCLPLVGAIAAWAARRSGRVAGRLPVAGYLAGRGLAARAVAAGALAGLVGLPVGIFVYSFSLTGTIQSGVRQKSLTYVGADHAIGTVAQPAAAIDTRGAGTAVSVITGGAQIGATQVSVLGVEPSGFSRHAYRGDALHGELAKLTTGRVVPAILVNAGHIAPHRLELRDTTLRIRVIDRMTTFPGLRDRHQPLLVVNRDALTHVDPFVNRDEEVWTGNDDLPSCLSALMKDHIRIRYEIALTRFVDASALLPVTWAFDYLTALGGLVALLALTGLVTATAARTRRRATAYHLFRRMGMSSRTHQRAIVAELGAVVLLGLVSGAGLAMAAVALIYRALDVNTAYPPPAPLVLPRGVLTISVVVAAATVVLTAVQAHRQASRSSPAEAMRLE